MLKNSKGITLVALVVTIVVLLILAGVSLSLTVGTNGIISRAKEARNAQANASTSDHEELNNIELQMNELLSGE